MKKGMILSMLAATLLLFGLSVVAAEPVYNVTNAAEGAADTWAAGAAENTTANGGEIIPLDLTATTQSTNWNGYVGTVVQSLQLQGAGSSFYSWGSSTPTGGVVLFSPVASVAWASISAAVAANATSEDTTLGLTGLTDAVNETFILTNAAALNISGNEIASGSSISTNTTGPSEWETVMVQDGTNMLYAGVMNPGGDDYAGGTADYQAMVPVTAGGTRTYYLFLSI